MTFRQFYESLEVDTKAMGIIQRGLEIRPDREDGKTFWDDFLAVIGNNSEGAASLLEVPSDKISTWAPKIRRALSKVREENGGMSKTGV